MVLLFGEVTSNANCNYPPLVRRTLERIGWNSSDIGFDFKTCSVLSSVDELKPTESHQAHADQGIVFGYATDETEECMPLSHLLATRLCKRLAEARRLHVLPWLRPDGKAQVTLEYRIEDGGLRPVRIHTVVVSAQHSPNVTQEKIQSDLLQHVVKAALPSYLLDEATIYHLNPSGRFVIGGPMADKGVTGRKVIVDAYGGWGAHGGSSFSGKDPSSISRAGTYGARWIAKSLVKSGLCRRVLLQIAYVNGLEQPVSVNLHSYGTGSCTDAELLDIITRNFDLRIESIVTALDLRRPIYERTACYGHFGHAEYPWEREKVLQYT